MENIIKLLGNKGEKLWYPVYAPHIILGTKTSIIDCIGSMNGYGLLDNNSTGIIQPFGKGYKRK